MARSFIRSIWGSLRIAANNDVFAGSDAGAPTNGTSGTGAGIAGIGSTYTNVTTGAKYTNTGTKASPTWTANTPASASITTAMLQDNSVTSAKIAASIIQQATGTISAANIVSTSAGAFGHASGVVLVAPQGAHNVVELISVLMGYDFGVAAYTGGGNITVNNAAGGSALTGLVSAANSVGAASDKTLIFVPLSTAAIIGVENGGLNLVTSGAFTQPGTATGVINWVCNYRVVPTSLT